MDFQKTWPEMGAGLLLVVGFFFGALTIKSKFMVLLLAFLWGLIFGRLWYRCQDTFRFPWALIILGFLVGYILASLYLGYSIVIYIIIFFILGIGGSYYVHDKGILKSSEF